MEGGGRSVMKVEERMEEEVWSGQYGKGRTVFW